MPISRTVALVAELCQAGTEFAALWDRHEVAERQGERRIFAHPDVGVMNLYAETLRFGEDGERMTVYQATPGTADYEALLALAKVAACRIGR